MHKKMFDCLFVLSNHQRACVGHRASTVRLLIKSGHCDPHMRCPQNGWVALHEAAMRGNVECVKVSFSF